jgi:hypothetical protein
MYQGQRVARGAYANGRVMRAIAPAEGASGCCRGIPRESKLSPIDVLEP